MSEIRHVWEKNSLLRYWRDEVWFTIEFAAFGHVWIPNKDEVGFKKQKKGVGFGRLAI